MVRKYLGMVVYGFMNGDAQSLKGRWAHKPAVDTAPPHALARAALGIPPKRPVKPSKNQRQF